jgi:hypothetical protein
MFMLDSFSLLDDAVFDAPQPATIRESAATAINPIFNAASPL